MSSWKSTENVLPQVETPVLILHNGILRIGELRWDHPGPEDMYESYRYWDDPADEGQIWESPDVTHWTALPKMPASKAKA